jgi:hypothetical protein
MNAQVPHIATTITSPTDAEAHLDTSALAEVRANHEQACCALHDRFVALARDRGRLDALELDAIWEAYELQVWKYFGQPDLRSYHAHVCGYKPHVANDRERVAREILDLPAIRDQLEHGLHYSKVRELVRVATRDTEGAWLEAVRGKNLREVERLVTGHKKGDLPTDPPAPVPQRRVLVLEVSPETYAAYRQAKAGLSAECGESLDDDLALQVMARRALEVANLPETPHPAAQVAMTLCPGCRAATVDAAGIVVDVDDRARDQALCDAEHLGDVEAEPARVASTLTPRKRRQVFARDHHRCVVPTCRAGRCLEIHHLEHREDGGGHEMWQIAVMCTAHHNLYHRGKLEISGKAPRLSFRRVHANDDGVDELGECILENDPDPRGSTTGRTGCGGCRRTSRLRRIASRQA